MSARRRGRTLLCALLLVGEMSLAGSLSSRGMRGNIRKQPFGKTASGEQIDLYSLTKDVNILKIDSKLPVEQGYLLRGNE